LVILAWVKYDLAVHLSQRALRIGESATLRVARRALELKAQGVDIVDFGAGEPDFDSPAVAVQAACNALETGFTRYTAGSGTPQLREAIAASYHRRYGSPWTLPQSVITVGGKCALFELAMAAFEAGDEVIVPAPAWVSFEEQIRFAGAEPVMVPTEAAESFRIRAEPILGAMTPRTRAVLINSPANPTGGIIEADDLRRVAAACRERGAFLIADETYDRFVYDGVTHASAAALAAEMPDTIVLVGSFSKTYAMTGWRIGYLLGPLALVRAVEAIQSHATSNPTSFAMKGALAALESAEPDVLRMIEEFEARRNFLVPRLNAIPGICCRPPSGAFYAFPDVSGAFAPGRANSLEFAEYLLREARVAVVPGSAFGADRHIRISFACSRATLEEGMTRIAALLSD
jgi:aspartate aminotransferase